MRAIRREGQVVIFPTRVGVFVRFNLGLEKGKVGS